MLTLNFHFSALEMGNFLLSSSLNGKPFLFSRRFKRKCKSEDQVDWFSSHSFPGQGLPRGLCVTHRTTRGAIHWGQTWSACCWLSESSSYNNKFAFVLRRKITGTCLLWAKDQNHRLYNLWNGKANAFIPAQWGNWGPEIGRARAKVTLLVSGGSTSILIGWDI